MIGLIIHLSKETLVSKRKLTFLICYTGSVLDFGLGPNRRCCHRGRPESLISFVSSDFSWHQVKENRRRLPLVFFFFVEIYRSQVYKLQIEFLKLCVSTVFGKPGKKKVFGQFPPASRCYRLGGNQKGQFISELETNQQVSSAFMSLAAA